MAFDAINSVLQKKKEEKRHGHLLDFGKIIMEMRRFSQRPHRCQFRRQSLERSSFRVRARGVQDGARMNKSASSEWYFVRTNKWVRNWETLKWLKCRSWNCCNVQKLCSRWCRCRCRYTHSLLLKPCCDDRCRFRFLLRKIFCFWVASTDEILLQLFSPICCFNCDAADQPTPEHFAHFHIDDDSPWTSMVMITKTVYLLRKLPAITCGLKWQRNTFACSEFIFFPGAAHNFYQLK